ncbi:hypothetical protein [Xanthomonas oryzae]|uniref:hypothetical protein n=1 Tax=Xanthomonas oryzae TaxID=347 RepID=UPI0002E1C780|nr:hypothetical protein [Xanthomonas oryzae]
MDAALAPTCRQLVDAVIGMIPLVGDVTAARDIASGRQIARAIPAGWRDAGIFLPG